MKKFLFLLIIIAIFSICSCSEKQNTTQQPGIIMENVPNTTQDSIDQAEEPSFNAVQSKDNTINNTENSEKKITSYHGVITDNSYEKGGGYDIQLIKEDTTDWKMVFVKWNNGSVWQTLEKKIDFDIHPSSISVPVTIVDLNRDGYSDFIIDYGILGKVRKAECIIWNNDILKYDVLEGFSELCDAEIDIHTGIIYDHYKEGADTTITNQYLIDKNKLELAATMIVDFNNGQPKFTEKRKIDNVFVVVQENLFESEMSFDGWNRSMLTKSITIIKENDYGLGSKSEAMVNESEERFKEKEDRIQNITIQEDLSMGNMWETYSTLVEKYYYAQEDFKKTGKIPEDDYNTLYFAPNDTRMEEISNQQFLLYDINSDGIPELFIARYYSDENTHVIYDAYTWNDNKAIRFLKDKNIGYRNGTCDIRENGFILSFFSGSAWDYGFEVLQLPKFGNIVEKKECFWAVRIGDRDNYNSDFYWRKEGEEDSKKISEEEYLEYLRNFKIPNLPYVDISQDSLSALRNGEIKY